MAALCLALCAGIDARAANPTDPLSLYGPRIEFDVYRNGSKVGYHHVRLSQIGAEILAESEFTLRIKLLFITAYSFDYRSQAVWREGQLQRLDVKVDDDGKLINLTVRRDGDVMKIDGRSGRISETAPLFPTNHWHAGVLKQSRVLNTLTGRINKVLIAPAGMEAVETEHGRVEATRYVYSGDLQTEVWYDGSGRWVKMRFEGRDGTAIDYVCRLCQGPAGGKTAVR